MSQESIMDHAISPDDLAELSIAALINIIRGDEKCANCDLVEAALDELHGLARDLNADSVFKNHDLNMDVLYHIAETQQVQFLEIELAILVSSWHISAVGKENGNGTSPLDVVTCLNFVYVLSVYRPMRRTDTEDFNNYGIGKDSFSWALQGEEISDSLRFFVEECDHIQGFQFVVDDSRGFSAVAKEFLENIVAKYTNTPILLYAVQGHRACTSLHSKKPTVLEDLHDDVSFSRLLSYSKLIVPLGLPSLSKSKVSKFLRIEDEKHYHSSAIYAAALHSINLSFRMDPVIYSPTTPASSVSGAVDLHGVIQMLSGQERQNLVSVPDVAIPAPNLSGEQNELSLLENLHPLTPQIAEDVEDTQAVECMTVNGTHASGVVYERFYSHGN
ncbi:hypothetical protein Ahy_B05g079532 [Arachis hypogaea]|uniref:DML1/Misato tubulin domain-containing protein n=1 Tax=Arachis hypogaea TaxID=3818 RepID=A0A444ZA99_ARAHY|nr:hypothetical protein Ahy_B05g079532 [Arachis hypogaea]